MYMGGSIEGGRTLDECSRMPSKAGNWLTLPTGAESREPSGTAVVAYKHLFPEALGT